MSKQLFTASVTLLSSKGAKETVDFTAAVKSNWDTKKYGIGAKTFLRETIRDHFMNGQVETVGARFKKPAEVWVTMGKKNSTVANVPKGAVVFSATKNRLDSAKAGRDALTAQRKKAAAARKSKAAEAECPAIEAMTTSSSPTLEGVSVEDVAMIVQALEIVKAMKAGGIQIGDLVSV